MEEAIQESLESLKYNDIPVGAIIVKDGKVIAKGYNQKEEKQNFFYPHLDKTWVLRFRQEAHKPLCVCKHGYRWL